ncbi:endo-1,4-beta-xylanase [Streptomyces ipomoeae]|uniref:Beta-xylanase n=1 Tax=Streptomyces ipomoeae 91-03 TaxID=698759 RepID=L1L6H2_9ACTN|nr:endo-1,4-beta-xylanase [Streptomyces ipomoeae]EKX68275.1 glycosyl hydrolase family 10 [Streptomyces ipomoeae 91-03]MDX2697716.1 endo-1,4-beta-xylanase [Streptomyces ipomoeae]MDX2824763.1 endo-1,4-beta-xylanase [Streptomyces ipomoeae]MDX2843579.1 endo-1,4-beta-xylanase [Streptomyces ipomoeae]MDX2877750.1 endo-1,4-beta-xylanase [Streptomyces ipomoeae]
MRSLRKGLSLTSLLTGVVALGALLVAAPAAHAADPPLRDLAAAKGKAIGTAVTGSKLTGTYGEIAGREFNWLTPGNAMKWGSVEPTRGNFNWTEADQIVAFAEAHDQDVRGHTLVWHSQNPSWLTNGTWTSAQLGQLMTDHIALEVGRYKGRLAAWDVVNEPFNEDGTYRQTLWYNGLGADYIAQALTAARAADPAAKLYINDYNVEGVNAKSTALYNLVRDLKARGVPIDGVGLQAHLILGQVPSTLQQNIQRFADLGVDVAITELDIRMQLPATEAKLAQQRTEYETVVKACVAVTRCTGVTVWGFTDSDSWIPDTFPGQGAATPYDENYAPKPAYYGIVTALGGTVTEPPVPDGCTAAYRVASQWNTGFTGNVTISCSGASLSSWRVNWTFGAGQQISQAWNATCTQSGATVSCVNASWNGSVSNGGSVTFGFNASWSGSNPVPTVTLG